MFDISVTFILLMACLFLKRHQLHGKTIPIVEQGCRIGSFFGKEVRKTTHIFLIIKPPPLEQTILAFLYHPG